MLGGELEGEGGGGGGAALEVGGLALEVGGLTLEDEAGGGLVEPVPDETVMSEDPLLWYPSVARIW